MLTAVTGAGAALADAPVGKVTMTAQAQTGARGDTSNRLHIVVWYPAAAGSAVRADTIGPPDAPLFAAGDVADAAPLAAAPATLPLVVLSHGTGGSAMQMAWLGTRLAANGYVAAAIDHPGNSFTTGYTTQGFALWWFRATDLSRAIDAVLADARFGPRIDRRRIAGAGFSLGGATVIVAAGGRVDMQRLLKWCGTSNTDLCAGPPEFPDLAKRIGALASRDAAFRSALAEDSVSYRDSRIRAVFAMAPAMGPAFVPQTLATVATPVAIVAGFGDRNIGVEDNAMALALAIPDATLHVFARPASHYTFLDECLAAGRAQFPSLCADTASRAAIHDETARLATAFFARTLAP
jgi:predicted dienelactone hydrolase